LDVPEPLLPMHTKDVMKADKPKRTHTNTKIVIAIAAGFESSFSSFSAIIIIDRFYFIYY